MQCYCAPHTTAVINHNYHTRQIYVIIFLISLLGSILGTLLLLLQSLFLAYCVLYYYPLLFVCMAGVLYGLQFLLRTKDTSSME